MSEHLKSSSRSVVQSTPLLLFLAGLALVSPMSVQLLLLSTATMAADLDVDMASMGLTLSGYFFGLAMGQLIYGPLSDAVGRRFPLILGLCLYCLATMGCFYAQSINIFFMCRAIQAMGACATMVTSKAIVRDLFTPTIAAKTYSLLMLASGVAPLLAPVIGGYIHVHAGWRYIYLLLLIWALFLLVLQSTVWPTIFPHLRKPSQKTFIRTTCFNVAHLLRDLFFLQHVVGLGLLCSGFFAYMSGSAFVFMQIFGLTPAAYGWLVAANGLALMLVSQVNRKLLDRYRLVDILVTGSWLTTALAAALLFQAYVSMGLVVFAITLLFYVASLGLIFPNTMARALTFQGERAATAAALAGVSQWALAGVSSAAVSYLSDGSARPLGFVVFVTALLGACGFSFNKYHQCLRSTE